MVYRAQLEYLAGSYARIQTVMHHTINNFYYSIPSQISYISNALNLVLKLLEI